VVYIVLFEILASELRVLATLEHRISSLCIVDYVDTIIKCLRMLSIVSYFAVFSEMNLMSSNELPHLDELYKATILCADFLQLHLHEINTNLDIMNRFARVFDSSAKCL
jgi:hypothetical protein